MKGDHAAADIVIAAHPEVFNLNIETVRELQKAVRPQADYARTLGVLRYVKEQDPSILTKTGFMVGLGETDAQISAPVSYTHLDVYKRQETSSIAAFTRNMFLPPHKAPARSDFRGYYTAGGR